MRRRATRTDTRNMVSLRSEPTFSHKAAALAAIIVLAISILAVRSPAAHGGPTHEVTEFTLPVDGSSPFGIATGPDGALWFSARGTDSVGSLATDGAFGPTTALAMASDPTAITAGPDGAVWFTEQGSGLIGRVTTDGTLTEFFLPSDGAGPAGIVTGPDGALWFTERSAHRVARMATDGTTVEFQLPTPVAGPVGIAVGSDGNLWFTEQRANQIGRITTDGVVTEYPVPVASSLPTGIAAGPDGALWFTMRAANRIGRIDTAGNVTTFAIPTAATDPTGIAAGWDGALWFTEPDTDAIGRITTGRLHQGVRAAERRLVPVRDHRRTRRRRVVHRRQRQPHRPAGRGGCADRHDGSHDLDHLTRRGQRVRQMNSRSWPDTAAPTKQAAPAWRRAPGRSSMGRRSTPRSGPTASR